MDLLRHFAVLLTVIFIVNASPAPGDSWYGHPTGLSCSSKYHCAAYLGLFGSPYECVEKKCVKKGLYNGYRVSRDKPEWVSRVLETYTKSNLGRRMEKN